MYVRERCPLWYCSDAGVGRLSEVLNLDSNGSDNAVEMEPMEKFGTGSQRDNSPLVPPVPLHRQERRPQCRSVRTEWIPDGHRGPHQRDTKGLFARWNSPSIDQIPESWSRRWRARTMRKITKSCPAPPSNQGRTIDSPTLALLFNAHVTLCSRQPATQQMFNGCLSVSRFEQLRFQKKTITGKDFQQLICVNRDHASESSIQHPASQV